MTEEYIKALGLPDEKPPEPERMQLKMELGRSGVLIWLLHEMKEELEGYTNNILYADHSEAGMTVKVTQWQAKRQVLEQWLGKLVQMTSEGEE